MPIMLMRLEKEAKEKEEAQKQLTLQREKHYKWKHKSDNLVEKRKIYSAKRKSQKGKRERAQKDSMEVGNTILKEANAKLQAALKKWDFKEVSVAQAMIEAA